MSKYIENSCCITFARTLRILQFNEVKIWLFNKVTYVHKKFTSDLLNKTKISYHITWVNLITIFLVVDSPIE